MTTAEKLAKTYLKVINPNQDPLRYDGKFVKISAHRVTLPNARKYFRSASDLNIPEFNKSSNPKNKSLYGSG